jgi:hypothetical protein
MALAAPALAGAIIITAIKNETRLMIVFVFIIHHRLYKSAYAFRILIKGCLMSDSPSVFYE